MNRRSLLTMIGIAPLLPIAAARGASLDDAGCDAEWTRIIASPYPLKIGKRITAEQWFNLPTIVRMRFDVEVVDSDVDILRIVKAAA